MQVVCQHPRIIINPLLPNLIAKHKKYYFRGKLIDKIFSARNPLDFDFKPFSVKLNNIVHDDLDSCNVLGADGELYPIYLEVPCGKCDICKVSKINSFVNRCMLETECYDFKPYFITLTYNNYNLPSAGVQKRDAQLFLKRFRINLERSGFAFKIRYVLVGEYGSTTHRPHYHAIIWNIQSKSNQEYLKVIDLLNKSWTKGFCMARLINPEDDKGFYYTSKYLKKDCFVPEGCNPTFMLSSRGHGGIGSRFIDKIAPELRKTLNVNFKFFSKWKQKVCELQYSRYLLNRVFPSFCRSVSSALRNSIILFNDLSNYLKYRFYDSFTPDPDISNFISDFGRYHYLSEGYSKMFSGHPFSRCYLEQCLFDFAGLLRKEKEKFERKTSFAECFEFARKRDLFLGKLFLYQHPVDLKMRSYACRKILNYSSISEVL